jgi:hypothetical protein
MGFANSWKLTPTISAEANKNLGCADQLCCRWILT